MDEKLIDCHNLILLNDSVHTWFDTYHQTSSLLDLSLCHPSVYMDVACEISSDRLGSDHHPIIITANTSDHPVPERVPKWNFKKAKWDAFQDQCITEITPDLFNDAEDKMAIFSSTLLDIAADNIPKTSPFPKRKAKPWFDEDCQAAKKERNKANRLANKHPSAANSMRARLIQARTKKLFKQKKHDSWKKYWPIALTSCICKTVERMVNERLVWFLEKNRLLAKQQCGYRANRSTVDHLIRLETYPWCIYSKSAFSCCFLWFTKGIWYYMETWYPTRLTWYGLTREFAHFYW